MTASTVRSSSRCHNRAGAAGKRATPFGGARGRRSLRKGACERILTTRQPDRLPAPRSRPHGEPDVASDGKAGRHRRAFPVAARFNAADDHRPLSLLRWGLVPSWSKGTGIASKLINARAETLTEKASFKTDFRKRRCLVTAYAFYEWREEGSTKQPIAISTTDNGPFGMAGMWEGWRNPETGSGCIPARPRTPGWGDPPVGGARRVPGLRSRMMPLHTLTRTPSGPADDASWA